VKWFETCGSLLLVVDRVAQIQMQSTQRMKGQSFLSRNLGLGSKLNSEGNQRFAQIQLLIFDGSRQKLLPWSRHIVRKEL
jgi:hypothetical protein